jgi:subtilase family serine protease
MIRGQQHSGEWSAVLVKRPENDKRRARRTASGAAIVLVAGLAATGAGLGATRAVAAAGTAPLAGLTTRPETIFMHKHAMKIDQPYTSQECQQQFQVNCYTPTQIQQAYSLQSLYSAGITGRGTTIVLVDAYGSPTISADLSEFDNEASLPSATLKVLHPVGRIPSYDPSNANMLGWAAETTLDVEWAHVIAPGATIDLLEVPGVDDGTLMKGIQYAISHRLGDVISQSWGGAEQSLGTSAIDYMHKIYARAVGKHITVVAATGDQGATQPTQTGYYDHPETLYPATDPDVVAVGGTRLDLGSSGNRLAADTAWNDTYNQAVIQAYNQDSAPIPTATGGGYSMMFRRPSYQYDVRNIVRDSRGIPDISMSASCSDSVQVYQSFTGQTAGWDPVCGTSEAAPIFAGIVALADQKARHSLGFINPVIYELAARHASGIVQVTSGNNTVAYTTGSGTSQATVTIHGYYARHGYSLVTGVGTVNGRYFVSELASPGSGKSPSHGKKPHKKPVGRKHHSLCAGHVRSSRLPPRGWRSLPPAR